MFYLFFILVKNSFIIAMLKKLNAKNVLILIIKLKKILLIVLQDILLFKNLI